ncbi:hypothetical protein P8825_14940 [Shouchella clausii]|uniref:hypothetical protein n=1 Tax=Shouchella clausii TaxID=79880 RepID=UPI002DBC255D|nr:hypothetical protein [Shouchella clausii]MEB5480860.1 hypothetical protein [Shouchella clausii]
MNQADYLINQINASAELAVSKANEWLNDNEVDTRIKDLYNIAISNYKNDQEKMMDAYKNLKSYDIDNEKLERKLTAFLKMTDLQYVWLADRGLTFTEDRLERLGMWIEELYIRLIDTFHKLKQNLDRGSTHERIKGSNLSHN